MAERNPRNDDVTSRTSDEPETKRNEEDLVGSADDDFEDVDEIDEDSDDEGIEDLEE